MTRHRFHDWTVIERSTDTVFLRGPGGYVRVQKIAFQPTADEEWAMTVKAGDDLVKRRSRVPVVDDEELWRLIKQEIQRVEDGHYE